MAYEARYVFRPNPGADLGAVIEAMKQGEALWKKHGATGARMWSVASGELGNYVLSLEFKNASEYAKVSDPLSAEVSSKDHLDLPRIVLPFDRWHFSRLHALIADLNALVPAN